MLNNLYRVRAELKEHYLALQRLKRFVDSEQFELAYEKAKEDEREWMENAIKTMNHERLLIFTRNILRGEYEQYNMRELRELAKKYGVSGWLHLSRDSLLSEISKYVK